MNILFVNYGDFTTNSLNHIGGFANTLCAAGHACVVAVAGSKDTISHIAGPLFIPASYAEALETPKLFPDGRPADIVHAWTPREGVRKFVLAYQRATGGVARVLVHLEDNERFLLEAYTGKSFDELRSASIAETDQWLVDGLSHPLRHEGFLRLADGVTHIVERLVEFAPPGLPTQLLPPGVDFSLYAPRPADQDLRSELGLAADDKILVFTGSNTFANESEMRELYLAVALLNQRGMRTRLIRTGFNSPTFLAGLSTEVKAHVLDLGFVEKAMLPRLLALADVLVQPGHAGPFNDYRLPSKLPEFLAVGRPVVLPPTNLALLMQNGREATFLSSGTPEEIADICARLFDDPELCAALGKQAVAFARQHFDLAANTRALSDFYTKTIACPAIAEWNLLLKSGADEISLLAEKLRKSALIAGPTSTALATEADLLGRIARDQIDRTEAKSAHLLHQAQTERQSALSREELTQQHVRNLEKLHATEREAALDRDRLTQQHVANLENLLATEREAALDRNRLTQQHVANLENLLATERQAALDRDRLTQQHIANLEKFLAIERGNVAELQKVRELTEKHANNLTRELDLQKYHRDQAEADLQTTRLKLAASETARTAVETEIARLRGALAATDETLRLSHHNLQSLQQTHAIDRASAADQLARANAVIRSREEKIAKMQASFSWKITTPLRAARRALLDRPAPPEPSAKIFGNIDHPANWDEIPPTLEIRGWSLHRDGVLLKGVRARLGDQIVPGEFGLARADVLSHYRDHPGAGHCGWNVKVEVPRFGTHPLAIEAQEESGAWLTAHFREVKRTADLPPSAGNTYAAWVAAHDTLTPDDADRIREKIAALEQRPLISVLMPTYNTPEKWLVRAIESVRRQLYENWELCIADDASTQPHVRKVLESYRKKDRRIKIVFRETNGHISSASNSALALAGGEFLALLDHDDEIRPHALAEVAFAIAKHPDLVFIYSDEDKLDEAGQRMDPYFKPDWNPDLLLGQNYTCHLSVFRTQRLRDIGGFRLGYEGSQDWDLTLRATAGLDSAQIHHIPLILYHWRAIPGSTALLADQKNNYPYVAAQKALTDHLARTGTPAELVPVEGHHWRVRRLLPSPPPKVSIIIPTKNAENLLRLSVGSVLAKTTYPDFEVLVVNNRSDDPGTLAYFDELRAAGVRVIDYDAPFNFSAINNFAVREARGTILAFLNNDLEVITPDWLEEMAAQAVRPEIGAVGAMLYYPNNTVQHAGVVLGLTGPALRDGVAGHAFKCSPRGTDGQRNRLRLVQNYSAVTAACLVIRKELFDAVEGFNERDLGVAFNDIDFCLRVLRSGHRNLWTPFAEFYHHESASRGAEDTPEKIARFQRETAYMRQTWAPLLDRDPAYNPNLSLTSEDFALAFPPRP